MDVTAILTTLFNRRTGFIYAFRSIIDVFPPSQSRSRGKIFTPLPPCLHFTERVKVSRPTSTSVLVFAQTDVWARERQDEVSDTTPWLKIHFSGLRPQKGVIPPTPTRVGVTGYPSSRSPSKVVR